MGYNSFMRSLKGKKVTWYDVVKPNDDDIVDVSKLHKFHPLLIDEIAHPSSRTRVEQYDEYLFIVYHLPEYDPVTKTSRRSEIDFLITKDKIITIHYEPLKQLDGLFEQLGKNEKERSKVLGDDSLMGVYSIFERIIAFSLRQLRHIEEDVSSIGSRIFENNSDDLLRDISYIKRDIIDYRLVIHGQERFFERLHDIGMEFWGKKSRVYLNDLINDNQPVHRNLENYFQTIESLETTHAQLVGARTNKIIKRFTVGAFLFTIPLYFAFYSEFEPFKRIIAPTEGRFWLSWIIINASVIIAALILKKRKMV